MTMTRESRPIHWLFLLAILACAAPSVDVMAQGESQALVRVSDPDARLGVVRATMVADAMRVVGAHRLSDRAARHVRRTREHEQPGSSFFVDSRGEVYWIETSVPIGSGGSGVPEIPMNALQSQGAASVRTFLERIDRVSGRTTFEPLAYEVEGTLVDTQPPVVVSASVSPTSVDVTDADQTVDVEVRLTDDESGVSFVLFYLDGPGESDVLAAGATMVSGTALDGLWQGSFLVPQFSTSGTWTLRVYAFDSAFNILDQATGQTVDVVGQSDAAPPTVSGTPTLTPSAVDLSTGPQTVTAQARVLDDVSGVWLVEMSLRRGQDGIGNLATLVSGSALDGVWEGSIEIPENAATGDWTLWIEVWDNALNTAEINGGVTLAVQGGDTVDPYLTGSVILNPTSVAVAAGDQTVLVTIPIADDDSGVLDAYVVYRMGSNEIFGGFATLVSGDAFSGVWEATTTIPQAAPVGSWETIIVADDAAFNTVELATGVTLEVTDSDAAAPTLAGTVSVDPSSVDVSGGSRSVTVTAPVLDNLSGVSNVEVFLQKGFAQEFGGQLSLISGDALDGVWEGPVELFQGMESGLWEIVISASDSASNNAEIPSGVTINVTGSDTEGPQIAGTPTIDPASIDVSTGEGAVQVSLQVTDAGSGVESVRVRFEQNLEDVGSATAVQVSGTAQDGSWEATSTIPQKVFDGDYQLVVTLRDQAGNEITDRTGQILAVSGGDVVAPQVAGAASISASEIDITDGPGTVTLSIPVSDSGSGVRTVTAHLMSGATMWLSADASLSSGSAASGVWEAVINVDVPDGTYNVELDIHDVAGNRAQVTTGLTLRVVLPQPGVVAGPRPLDGDLQVDRMPTLTWEPVRAAREYDLFVWKSSESKPGVPLAVPTVPRFDVPARLEFNTVYNWQLVARNASGESVGPVWSFTTVNTADLTVSAVQVSPLVQSGQTIEIQWTVANGGQVGTSAASWNDRVYVSDDLEIGLGDITIADVPNLSFLGAGESYANTVNATLPRRIFGSFYILVATDYYRRQTEIDETNNIGSSAVQIDLPPAPDLTIVSFSAPSEAFSGSTVMVQWTVENGGVGFTDVDNWKDGVYLSTSSTFDTESATRLRSFNRVAALAPDSSYTVSRSVELPDAFSGQYYLHFVTDIEDSVFEQAFELNNTRSSALNVILAPPPDLVVEGVTPPTSGASGQSIDISWTVRNAGAGRARGVWQDRVYLSESSTFEEATAVVVGAVVRPTELDPDETYAKQALLRLPDGITGPRYIHVVADWRNDLFEHTFEDNNRASSSSFTVDLSPWPDLLATDVTVASVLTAGEEATAFWRTSNSGTASAAASWRDSLFVSTAASWNRSAAIPVGATLSSSALGVGNSRANTGRMRVPATISGNYYVYVKVDGANEVYEHTDEGNNIVRSGPVSIVPPPSPDLSVVSLSAPSSASAGNTTTIGWTVRNEGPGSTQTSGWLDLVFLSADQNLDVGSDVLLLWAPRREPLSVGASYTRSLDAAVPVDVAGEYYVIVAVDQTSVTADATRSNNVAVSAVPTTVAAYVAPDLTVLSVATPDSVTSGQPLAISWTVKNQGAGSAASGSRWADRVFLSADATVGEGDVLLGAAIRDGGLEIDQSYTASLDVEIPLYVSGAMYVIVETDGYNSVPEDFESNNAGRKAITAVSAPPSDLVVSQVVADPSAIVGDDVTVSWILRNIGANPVSGHLSQGVYMSEDEQWQLADLFLGVHTARVDLAPGGQMKMTATFSLAEAGFADSTGSITTALPGVKPGSYRGLVRADLKNNIRESVEDNNVGVAASATVVDVPVLVLGVPVAGSWSAGAFKLYRVDVEAGVDLRLTLTAGRFRGNGLFVSYEAVPSPSRYDLANTDLSELDRELLVPSTQQGTYYVLATAQSSSSSGTDDSFSLLAEGLAFSIADVSPSRGGTPGRVTASVQGAGFRADSEVRLRRSGRSDVVAEMRGFLNTTEMAVRWDLTSVPTGTYDVVVRNADGSETTMAGGFQVVTALPPALEMVRNTPDQIRPERPNPYVFRFRNASNVDIDYAAIQIEVPSDATLRVTAADGLLTRSDLLSADSAAVGSTEDFLVSGGLMFVPLVARSLGPGQEVEAQLSITAAQDPGGEFPIRVVWKLMDRETFLADQTSKYEALRLHVIANPGDYPVEWVQLAADQSAFIAELLGGLVQVGMLGSDEVDNAVAVAGQRLGEQAELRNALTGGGAALMLDAGVALSGCNDFFRGLGCVITIIECIPEVITVVGAAACGLGIAACIEPNVPKPLGCLGIGSALNCLAEELLCNDLLDSVDPNDILGPNGYGDPRWVAASAPLGYTIRFENDPELATAPAQTVRITQDLDPDVDARTFRLGAFGFAGLDFSVPRNIAAYTKRLDVRDSLGIYVDVTAGVDTENSSVFWTLTSVDPTSGQLPSDPLAGFLAINDSLGSGEGYVTYTIKPLPDARYWRRGRRGGEHSLRRERADQHAGDIQHARCGIADEPRCECHRGCAGAI